MRKIFATMSLKWLPDVEDVSVKARTVTVKGPRGTLTRSFKSVSADIFGDKAAKKITVEMWFGASKENATLRTVVTHIKNMMTGVTKGFQYKMRFVYAHFPVNVNISDAKDLIEIRNFLGRRLSDESPCWRASPSIDLRLRTRLSSKVTTSRTLVPLLPAFNKFARSETRISVNSWMVSM